MPCEVCNPRMSLLLQVFVLVIVLSLSLTQDMASWGRRSKLEMREGIFNSKA